MVLGEFAARERGWELCESGKSARARLGESAKAKSRQKGVVSSEQAPERIHIHPHHRNEKNIQGPCQLSFNVRPGQTGQTQRQQSQVGKSQHYIDLWRRILSVEGYKACDDRSHFG